MVAFLAALRGAVTALPVAAKILKPIAQKVVSAVAPTIKKLIGTSPKPALQTGATTVSSVISKAASTKSMKVLTGMTIGSAIAGQGGTSRNTAGVLTATAFGGPSAGMGVAISTLFNKKSDSVPAQVNVNNTPLTNSVQQTAKITNVVGTGGVDILAVSAAKAPVAAVNKPDPFKVPDSMTPVKDKEEVASEPKTIKSILTDNIIKAQDYVTQKATGLSDNPTARDILLATTAATGGYLLSRLGGTKKSSSTKKKSTSTKSKKKSSSAKKSTKKSSSKAQKGKKLKFGSPAWRAKYLGRGRKKKKGKSVSVASIKRKGLPGPDTVRMGTEAQYKKEGGKKVYYTKTGQPYIKLKSGKARFIKKS